MRCKPASAPVESHSPGQDRVPLFQLPRLHGPCSRAATGSGAPQGAARWRRCRGPAAKFGADPQETGRSVESDRPLRKERSKDETTGPPHSCDAVHCTTACTVSPGHNAEPSGIQDGNGHTQDCGHGVQVPSSPGREPISPDGSVHGGQWADPRPAAGSDPACRAVRAAHQCIGHDAKLHKLTAGRHPRRHHRQRKVAGGWNSDPWLECRPRDCGTSHRGSICPCRSKPPPRSPYSIPATTGASVSRQGKPIPGAMCTTCRQPSGSITARIGPPATPCRTPAAPTISNGAVQTTTPSAAARMARILAP